MANWSARLAIRGAGNPVVEAPNAVAYIDYLSDDGRVIESQRIPYDTEANLLNFLAQRCAALAAQDDRLNSQIKPEIANTALVQGQVITLPDISAQQALAQAQADLRAKIAAAQIAQLAQIDPTIADAQAAVASAQQTVSAVKAPLSKAVTP